MGRSSSERVFFLVSLCLVSPGLPGSRGVDGLLVCLVSPGLPGSSDRTDGPGGPLAFLVSPVLPGSRGVDGPLAGIVGGGLSLIC